MNCARRKRPLLSAAIGLVLALVVAFPMGTRAQSSVTPLPSGTALVESNVVFGRYFGLALLMDVHRPQKPNGFGVVAIIGSGFQNYDAAPVEMVALQLRVFVAPLVAAGYTVFVINHRAAPRFPYPAAVEDTERAVRFVRSQAARFNIAADRIGAVGASSGGYLASMLGVRSGKGADADSDSVNRESARVQAVVALCPVEDLTATFGGQATALLTSFIGAPRGDDTSSAAWKLYQEASPIHHVAADAAPTLLVHGDADRIAPFEQSERMEAALRARRVPAKLIRLPGGSHAIEPNPKFPDFTKEMTGWLDRYLRGQQ